MMNPTRSKMRGADRRALILEEAKKAFAQKGYGGASTGELARASGITEPVLYKHFGSKRKLYLAVLSLTGAQFTERFRVLVTQRAHADLSDGLAHLLLDYRQAALDDLDGSHVLLNAGLESDDPEVAAVILAHERAMRGLIVDLLKRARRQGIVSRQTDLSAATWGFMSFLLALQFRAKAGVYEEFSPRTIREMNRLWLAALRRGVGG